MYKLKDNLGGKVQGKIQVIKRVPRPDHLKQSGSYWLYKCECGKKAVAHRTTIIRGLKSCWECGKEPKKYKTKSTKHYRTLYHIWHAMKKRCYREKDRSYQNYGGRGIKVCKRWLDFTNFYNDNIEEYKKGLSLERIDIDGNYKPSNCTWIPLAEQAKNRRSSLSYRKTTGYQWRYSA